MFTALSNKHRHATGYGSSDYDSTQRFDAQVMSHGALLKCSETNLPQMRTMVLEDLPTVSGYFFSGECRCQYSSTMVSIWVPFLLPKWHPILDHHAQDPHLWARLPPVGPRKIPMRLVLPCFLNPSVLFQPSKCSEFSGSTKH